MSLSKKIQMSASPTASSFYTKILLLCESVGRHLVTNCSDEVSYLFWTNHLMRFNYDSFVAPQWGRLFSLAWTSVPREEKRREGGEKKKNETPPPFDPSSLLPITPGAIPWLPLLTWIPMQQVPMGCGWFGGFFRDEDSGSGDRGVGGMRPLHCTAVNTVTQSLSGAPRHVCKRWCDTIILWRIWKVNYIFDY